jgi:hypothetical protein
MRSHVTNNCGRFPRTKPVRQRPGHRPSGVHVVLPGDVNQARPAGLAHERASELPGRLYIREKKAPGRYNNVFWYRCEW